MVEKYEDSDAESWGLENDEDDYSTDYREMKQSASTMSLFVDEQKVFQT